MADMSSHLNRGNAAAPIVDACAAASPIGYDATGEIVVRCRDEAGSQLVQEALIWFIVTSLIFLIAKMFLRFGAR